MKVTSNLLGWLQSEFNARGITYAELGRRGGTNYQNFQRLLQGVSAEIQQEMVDAVCAAFNVSEVQLIQIAKTGQNETSFRASEQISPYGSGGLHLDATSDAILRRRAADKGKSPEEYLAELLKSIDQLKNL